MYYEHQFYNSIYDSQKLNPHLPNNTLIIRAKRYIDDVLGFVAYDSSRPITHSIATRFITTLKNAYHPNMLFKDVPVVNDSTRFLETSVSIFNDNLIDVFHYDKKSTTSSPIQHRKHCLSWTPIPSVPLPKRETTFSTLSTASTKTPLTIITSLPPPWDTYPPSFDTTILLNTSSLL